MSSINLAFKSWVDDNNVSLNIRYPNMGYRSNQKRWRDQKSVQITWSKIRVEFAPSVPVWKWKWSKQHRLSLSFWYQLPSVPIVPLSFRHGVYKCTKPNFATCVTLHGQPVLREITVFDSRVTIKKIERKNNHGVIIRDRFQQICTGKCTL